MARVIELAEVREQERHEIDADQDTEVRHWYVSQATDETDARLSLKSEAPASLDGGLLLSHITVRERLSQSVYMLDVHYKKEDDASEKLELGQYKFSFDTTGRTFRRNTSLETIEKRLIAFDDPTVFLDFRQGINVSSDGSVEGVDVVTPSMKMQITKSQPATLIHNLDYVKTLGAMTGRVNRDEFLGEFGEKELLFLGATGSQSVSATIDEGVISTTRSTEITYHFEYQPTEVDIPIGTKIGGGVVKVPKKRGWEYLWVYFDTEEVLDGTGATLLVASVPVQWNLEDVYPTDDFGLLQI